jgi:hypothetical protein
MASFPLVVKAEFLRDRQIHLTFSDGLAGAVDFSEWFHGPIFAPLVDPILFKRFYLDGGTVAWPNGADVAPETLYERVRSQAQVQGMRFAAAFPAASWDGPSHGFHGRPGLAGGVRYSRPSHHR